MTRGSEKVAYFEEAVRADEKVRAEAYIALARLCEHTTRDIRGVGMENIAAAADLLHSAEPLLYKIARGDGITSSKRREYFEALKERYPFLFEQPVIK
jgi:hypothetical protein